MPVDLRAVVNYFKLSLLKHEKKLSESRFISEFPPKVIKTKASGILVNKKFIRILMSDSQTAFENERRERLLQARRIVVKLGTGTVTTNDGALAANRVEPIASQIADLKRAHKQVVLVSSGAVGMGAGKLGLHRARLDDLVTRQACAAVGQSLLMHAYEQLFHAHNVKIAQLLLTEADFTNRGRYTNLRRTIEKLLKLGVLPIINENDTVSTAELVYTNHGANRVFSDNDRLAALVAGKLEADALVLLTNVDGLLAKQFDQATNSEKTTVISLVTEVTAEIKALAAGPSIGGRGGMITKLEAAEIAQRAGGAAIIANGSATNVLSRIFAGEAIGTCFLPARRRTGKRRWIEYAADVRGKIIVNTGARQALSGGKASLLASGAVGVEHDFAAQDVVSIVDETGAEFARGIANCASQEAEILIENKENKIADQDSTLKKRVLITRNNIVLLN